MTYYHSNEQDRILSADDVRQEFEQFQREGQYIGEAFDDYLKNCMNWNNGDLTPVSDYQNALRRRIAYAEPDAVDDLRDQIAELEKYI